MRGRKRPYSYVEVLRPRFGDQEVLPYMRETGITLDARSKESQQLKNDDEVEQPLKNLRNMKLDYNLVQTTTWEF